MSKEWNETLHTMKYRQFQETEKLSSNFLRHYYDLYQLLDVPAVQRFIGTSAYQEHKAKRFKSENHNLAASGAFALEGTILKQFEAEYSKTAALYYRGQIPLQQILMRIREDLSRL